MANNHFRRGRAVFRCSICGRNCRDAGQATDAECCVDCYELAGVQNGVYDRIYEPGEMASERDLYFDRCVSRGGDAERIRREFPKLWRD
jgi:hypothetical protein